MSGIDPTRPGEADASPTPSEFTHAQRAGLEGRDADQDRTLSAVHRLESAVAAAAPGRRSAWRRDVLAALEELDAATRDEEANAARPESLLSDIARNQPRLRHRVHGLRAQYRHVRATIAALRRELADPDSDTDTADIRQRLAWLLTALRYERARESDLIYEAFTDGFDRELDADDRDDQ